jgi:glucose-6-phosphate isomerase
MIKGSQMSDPSMTPAWHELQDLARTVGRVPIRELIDQPNRHSLVKQGPILWCDFTRQRIDDSVLDALINLANECHVPEQRSAMFLGEHINSTEDRAVGHVALRMPTGTQMKIDGADVVPDVHGVLTSMSEFSEGVRSGRIRGVTGKRICSVVNIGIGGSDLGPAMAYRALRSYSDPAITMRFVSNVDPTDIVEALMGLDPESTLVIVSSKTFTTSETMANANVAKQWLIDELGPSCVATHMVAVSTNAAAIESFGIEQSFGFWDWVGGRYSMDSAIGLSTMIAIGEKHFHDLLDGFHAMDVHFQKAPSHQNLPLLMGLINVWNRNFLRIPSVAILPYSHALSRFPAYLQQLTMESNGKSVRVDGTPIDYETSAIFWGEPGTNGQHSFFQLLHQGTDHVACDIICFARNAHEQGDQHDVLIANALAQASVLSRGRLSFEIADESPHKVMPGNRPTTIIWGQELDPRTLGALVSLYEHAVFVQGAIWGINSFDQWGVELGKSVANAIRNGFTSDVDSSLDNSTLNSMDLYRSLRHE